MDFEYSMLNLAKRFIIVRRNLKVSQLDLSIKSGVSYGSIKRFERTGEISLSNLYKICYALNISDELDRLFIKGVK